jgi:hypothetical protein
MGDCLGQIINIMGDEVGHLAIFGPNPTMTLVANSANSHSSVMVDHDTAASSGNPGQFATSVNIRVIRGNKDNTREMKGFSCYVFHPY